MTLDCRFVCVVKECILVLTGSQGVLGGDHTLSFSIAVSDGFELLLKL